MQTSEKILREMLELAGIQVNGGNPWDIQVHDTRFYDRVLRDSSLGLGEAYMDGWWDCQALDQFFHRLLRARLQAQWNSPVRWPLYVLAFAIVALVVPAVRTYYRERS